MHNKSDQELIRLVALQHRPALEEIYDRYVKLIYSFAMRSVDNKHPSAKDIVQLVFTRLWTTQAVFDEHKGSFVSWLLTITRHITIDYLRKERKQQALEISLIQRYETEDHFFINPDQYLLQKEVASEVFQHLNNQQKRLLELLYWQGYTLNEIAEMHNEPLGTTKSRLHQSLKLLRKHFAPGWRVDLNEGK